MNKAVIKKRKHKHTNYSNNFLKRRRKKLRLELTHNQEHQIKYAVSLAVVTTYFSIIYGILYRYSVKLATFFFGIAVPPIVIGLIRVYGLNKLVKKVIDNSQFILYMLFLLILLFIALGIRLYFQI